MAEIHRRVYHRGGPAILFENVKGSPFQAVSNIYGTEKRTDYIFRKTLPRVKKMVELKVDPMRALKSPLSYLNAPLTALTALPKKTLRPGKSMYGQTTIDQLPLVKSWPMDGGAFVTLPQVLTLPPNSSNIMESNVGMYRIQLSGNDYKLNEEIGLHYQIHRGIGVHHTMYNASETEFKCSIFIGGPPSHTFCAIMPLPEGMSELTFAGLLGGRRFSYYKDDKGQIVSNDADFVITGTIQKNRKMPEGPFGDHLGYYSLQHDFPVMKVDNVYHRKDALWHFTVVGRPPQEDSSFGYLIHKIVKELTPGEFPGLVAINAVDAAGVHPLLLAIGQERYMPFRDQKPEEILTIANRILGSGQTSLAKFLWICAEHEGLDIYDYPAFFKHMLERVDWRYDLHFYTQTTIDTLDYSGDGWNSGSKVVIAANRPQVTELTNKLPDFTQIDKVSDATMIFDGAVGITYDKFTSYENAVEECEAFATACESVDLEGIKLIVLCDDAQFLQEEINNYLWVTFTRANPSHDLYGVGSFTKFKHWGCTGPLIIDARIKPHHAPELVTDKEIENVVDGYMDREGNLQTFTS
jgi:4-hydroxy-3-polyprenylbenzoate decarboxylase